MTHSTRLVGATPVLASLDIPRSVDFFVRVLGFESRFAEAGVYGVVQRDGVSIHFWACDDPVYPKATSCRVQVDGIDALYAHCQLQGIVHPRSTLGPTAWGTREFAILDPDGNLVWFHQALDASAGKATEP